MSMKVSEGSGNYPLHPAGLFDFICIWVVYLGLQRGIYGDKSSILLGFESPTVLMDDGRPSVITRRFGANLSSKGNFRAFLTPWRSRDFTPEELKEFDTSVLAGKPVKLLIQHTTSTEGKTYANIQASVRPDKGQSTQTHNPLVVFDADHPDAQAKALLPEWVQKLIDSAIPPTVKPTAAVPPAAPDFDDDLTF